MNVTRKFIVKLVLVGYLVAAFARTEVQGSTVPLVYIVMGRIEKAIHIHMMKTEGKRPVSLDELTQFADDDGQPLLKKEDLLDPWGEPFKYERSRRGFVLMSSGPDKKMGTRDDAYSGCSEIPLVSPQANQTPPVGRQEVTTAQKATSEQPPTPAIAERAETGRKTMWDERQPQNRPAEDRGAPWKLPLLVIGLAVVCIVIIGRYLRKRTQT